MHGEILGLIEKSEADVAYHLEEGGELPFDLNLITHSATLSSLQLLLILYREAQDMAQYGQASRLHDALQATADAFTVANGYSGEKLDTWCYLLHTRMLRWDPDFQPDGLFLKRAEEDLLEERKATAITKGKRRPSSPSSYTKGRAERRWRRQIWARACRLSLVDDRKPGTYLRPPYLYVGAALGSWLVGNRMHISEHYERAIELLMDSDPREYIGTDLNCGNLALLAMPESVYKLRERPQSDEETWRYLGDYLPFDLIPVVEIKGE